MRKLLLLASCTALGLGGLPTPPRAQVAFGPATSYASGSSAPAGLAVQDLNGDNKPDIVVLNAATVGVLLNTGTGTFPATATTYATGGNGYANSVAVGDVNADGKPDIVVLNSNDSTVGLLLGTGTGTFSAATTYWLGSPSYPSSLTVADVNGDGRADVLVANNYSASLAVLLGRSTGGFAAVVQYPVANGNNPQSVAVGDLNGDGKPDVVVGSSPNYVNVFLNTGTGTFQASSANYYLSTGISSISRLKIGDLTGDGKPDVVATDPTNPATYNLAVLPGNGTGGFGSPTVYAIPANSKLASVAVGDLNKDGRLDLVTANYGLNSAGVLLAQPGTPYVASIGTFSAGNNTAPVDVAIADINGDGKQDIITANSTTATVSVLLNTSTLLATQPTLAAASAVPYPNPAHDGFAVQVPAVAGAATVQVELRNALGQCVRRQSAPLPATGTTLTVPTTGLAPGVYLLRLQAGDQALVQRVAVY